MLRKLFKGKTNSIASAAIIVASFSLLSRVVGFIRDRIMAGEFGASDTLDVYFAAFRIPDLFFQLVVVGALSASFIPLFTKHYFQGNEKRAWQLTNNLLNVIAITFGILVIVAALFAPQLSPLIAPGFSPEKQAQVAAMSQVMFIAQFFLALSMVFGSALQGAKHFVIYSLAPIFYNVGIIVGVVVFVPELGPMGLAWGVVFGAILHLVLQFAGALSLGWSYRPIFSLRSPDVIYTLKHMLPRIMGLAVNQVNLIAMTVIASTLAVGSNTMLSFAYNINFLPIGVIGVSYAIAAFPSFCEYVSKDQNKKLVKSFSATVRQILLFIIPATFIFLLLRAQIVRVVVGAGEFDWPSTIVTSDILGFFAISFFAQALVFVLVRAYFAYSDTLTPFVVGLGAALLNVVAALFLTPIYGVAGLGMAYSLAAIVQLILLWVPLRQRIGSLDEWRILKSFGILLIAGVAGALVTQIMKTIVVQFITLETFFGVLGQGLIAGGIGLVVYGVIAFLLKSDEMMEFLRGMKRRLLKRTKPEETIVTEMGQ